MPNYTYRCNRCPATAIIQRPFSVGPVADTCDCGGILEHDIRADVATVECDTASCRDHNTIERSKRVFRRGTRAAADRKEAAYANHVKERRAALKDGGNKGKIKQTMAVPADLYHGKIRETKDRNYWTDPKNVSRHNDFKVG